MTELDSKWKPRRCCEPGPPVKHRRGRGLKIGGVYVAEQQIKEIVLILIVWGTFITLMLTGVIK